MASGKYGARVDRVKVQDIGERTGNIDIRNIEIAKLVEAEDNEKLFPIKEDELMLLVNDIKKNGIIQPIGVVAIDNGYYRIQTGHRRVRAAKMLEMARVPALVYKDVDEVKEREYLVKSNLLHRKLTAYQIANLIAYHEETLKREHANESRPKITAMLMEEFGLSERALMRYKELQKINEELKNFLDEKNFPFRPFVDNKVHEQPDIIQEKILINLKQVTDDKEISHVELVELIQKCISGEDVKPKEKKEKKEKEFSDEDIKKLNKKIRVIKTNFDNNNMKITDYKSVYDYIEETEVMLSQMKERLKEQMD